MNNWPAVIAAAADYCQSDDKNIRRLLHERGALENRLDCTLDGFEHYLLLTVYKTPADIFAAEAKKLADDLFTQHQHCLIIQHRDLARPTFYAAHPECAVPDTLTVTQNNLQYQLRFSAQNTGLFLDMAKARDWLTDIAPGKKVLNLFAYTCAFSVAAIAAGAEHCINVDMSSASLSWGRDNHRLNNLPGDKASYLALDILKSWSRIKKPGPYDVIIIDPPSFQKGSFIAKRDYAKLLRRIPQLTNPGSMILCCLNAPELGSDFLLSQMEEHCPECRFVERLEVPEVFSEVDRERELKLLVFEFLG